MRRSLPLIGLLSLGLYDTSAYSSEGLPLVRNAIVIECKVGDELYRRTIGLDENNLSVKKLQIYSNRRLVTEFNISDTLLSEQQASLDMFNSFECQDSKNTVYGCIVGNELYRVTEKNSGKTFHTLRLYNSGLEEIYNFSLNFTSNNVWNELRAEDYNDYLRFCF